MSAHEHHHDGQCCSHDQSTPEAASHSHVHLGAVRIMIGGALLLNSFLCDWVYGASSLQSKLCALASALLLGLPIIIEAFRDVWRGRFFMNELVALGILASFIDEDFRSAAAIAFFMFIAIAIEHRTAAGARSAIESLIRLTPRRARRLLPDGSEEEVDAMALRPGERIVARPGDTLAADGRIVSGQTSLNQSSITGESLPVDKQDGDEVFAGTQNLTGMIQVEVSRVGSETTLGRVRDLIEQAEQARLPVMRMIDRYTAYYIPAVLMVAAAVYVFSGFDLKRVIAILVIACPCALIVAVPSAVVAAVASCARVGLLIKDVAILERAARVRSLVFDKTGTLTMGSLSVSKMDVTPGCEPARLLQYAAAAEAGSQHPAAKAIVRLAAEVGLGIPAAQRHTEVPGRGVEADWDAKLVRVGRRDWLVQCGVDMKDFAPSDPAGKSIVYVADGPLLLGAITLADTIRPSAQVMVEQLKALGVDDLHMVTGDNASVAEAVGTRIGIDSRTAECLPQQKVAFVDGLRAQGRAVGVIGDGVNDAPALAAGDVSIAMGIAGSDIAVSSASVALMSHDLNRIPFFFRLARLAKSVMLQNLALGVLAIIGGMVLSALGYMNGVTAAILHSLATLLIIMNSARLVRQGEELAPSPSASVQPESGEGT